MAAAFPHRAAIAEQQLGKLRALLTAIQPANPFYTRKFAGLNASRQLESLADFSARYPFTIKAELAADQMANPPHGTHLTFPAGRYVRFHQTSGTSGAPLRWLDTPDSWAAMVESWARVFAAAGVESKDRVYFAFSFGPFIGFWLAFEAAEQMGCLCLPGGGLGSAARARMIIDNAATVLCCTPTYAIRLAEVATQEGIDLSRSQVRRVIVAGEPGGSIPATRQRIEELWRGARVFDHHGMTEVGPVTYECPAQPGVLHVMEHAFYAEVIDPATGSAAPPGQVGELVLTTLTRVGSPLLRYRTGDLVRARAATACACGGHELALEGGILGRVDDMVVVRGVNVYPSAIEEILRRAGDVAEYQVSVTQNGPLTELTLTVEPAPECADAAALAQRLQKELLAALALRVPVNVVAPATLPRFEMKARRWTRA
ncbi:MAG TPA: AMP-binding protein [Verrucomicrobiae bacterium]|nr:AMP-binding protein [Verrucomicrobiae bacterium]